MVFRSSAVKTAKPGTPTTAREGSRRAWAITAMLFAFILINFGDKAIIGLAAGPIRQELHLSATDFGLIASSFYFLFSISGLVVGFVSNRVSTKWILLALAAVWTISLVPLIGPASFAALLASRIALGAGEGPAWPMSIHTAHQWFSDRKRNLPTSIITLGSTIGVVFSGPLLTWLITGYSWHAAFGVLGLLSALWALVWLFVGKDGPFSGRRKKTIEELGDVEPTSPPESTEVAAPQQRISYWKLFRSGTFIGCVLASFAAYWSLANLVAWVPSYMETVLGFSAAETGTLIIFPWLVGFAGLLLQPMVSQRLLARGVPSRWARGAVGGLGVVVAGCAIAVLGFGPSAAVALVALIIGFEFGHMIHAVSVVVLAEIVPDRQRGAVQGTLLALLSVGGLIGPYVTGLLIDAAHTPAEGYQHAWALMAAVMVVSGVLAMVLINPAKAKARILAK
jgi:MFS family permease